MVAALKEYRADLRSEIHDTDDFGVRENLLEKWQSLTVIVSKFGQELVAAYE